jgi:hypothetical protein
MERIFNQNVGSSINKWYFNTNPDKQLAAVYEEAKNTEPTQFEFVSQCGSAEKIATTILIAESRLKSDAFRRMMRSFFMQKVQESKSLGSEDKLQLV